MKNKIGLFAWTGLAVLALSACSSGGSSPKEGDAQPPEAPKAPITLSVFGLGVKEEEFNDRFRTALEKKFPHITFKYIPPDKGNLLPELVARGETPDLIRVDIPSLKGNYLDLKLGLDLNEYVKKFNYDLSRFNKQFIQEMIDAGQSGALYGIPYSPYFPMVLTYNKDLFDKFGVAYPQDGMTFDETYEIAKKMSRTDGSSVYRGFSANIMSMLRDNPYGYPILDPNEDKLYDSQKWKPLFENFLRFYELPNNKIEATRPAEINDAFKKGNVAMQLNQYSQYLPIPEQINWDIVSYPTFKDAPKKMVWRGPAYWTISATSQHKDEAFQVIMEMVSDDIQMNDSRKGLLPVIASKAVQEAFNKDRPDLQNKNGKALFHYNDWAPYSPKRKSGLANIATVTQQDLMAQAFHDAASGKADINTALGQLDEKLKLELEKEKSK